MAQQQTAPIGDLSTLGADVFRCEALLKKRVKKGKTEYLVKWANYKPRFNSWEPSDNILDQNLISAFEARQSMKAATKRRKGRKGGTKANKRAKAQHQPDVGESETSSSDDEEDNTEKNKNNNNSNNEDNKNSISDGTETTEKLAVDESGEHDEPPVDTPPQATDLSIAKEEIKEKPDDRLEEEEMDAKLKEEVTDKAAKTFESDIPKPPTPPTEGVSVIKYTAVSEIMHLKEIKRTGFGFAEDQGFKARYGEEDKFMNDHIPMPSNMSEEPKTVSVTLATVTQSEFRDFILDSRTQPGSEPSNESSTV